MRQPKKKTPTSTPVRHEGEPISFYSNHTEIAISTWDFRFLFCEGLSSDSSGLRAKALAKVYLSPTHAKTISQLLVEKVKEYENQFGEIPKGPIVRSIRDI